MTESTATDPETPLADLDVAEFVARLASREPIPGGGSASALAGAMAAALVNMVVELSLGRPELADANGELTEIGLAASAWQKELLTLVELDAAAYAAVVRARRLPRDTDADRQVRSVQVTMAIREATLVPLRTAQVASETLDLAARVAPIGNPNAISDAGVAARLASAAVHGAALNVRINLPVLAASDTLRDRASTQITALVEGVARREAAALTAVEERMPVASST